MFWPLNAQRPKFGLSKPVNKLNSVVLPAPLGPINAVMAPRWISTCSTSTATNPPKVRRTSSATSIGSGFEDPASQATPWIHAAGAAGAAVGAGASAVTDQRLAFVAEYALRAEDHQQDEGDSDEHEPHDGDLAVVDQP